MYRRAEYEKLLNEMYNVYIESKLASPLSGSATINIGPSDTVRKVVNDFLLVLENHDSPCLAVFDKYYNKLDLDSSVESQGVKEGSKLYLVYDRSSFFQPIHITVVGISTFLIAIVLFVTASILFGTTGGDVPFDYGIVIDAGSTHTEVFLYQWSGSKFHGTGEVNQKDFCLIEVGISDGLDPGNLVSCVNNVTKSIPKDIYSKVILNLGATAGMRLLNISNPIDSHLILTAIKYALTTINLKSIQVDSVEIIQGKDEGLYSWITVNFLNKTLNQDKVNATFGALDLGGASTQIAIAVNKDVVTNSSDIQALKLYGHEYFVSSNSFLCFGLSKASDRSKALIFMNQWIKFINDPCLPVNYSYTIKTKKFLEETCVINENITKWLMENPDVKEINVSGSSNYEECKDVVSTLVDPVSCEHMGFKQCLSTIHVADPNRKFMAFSNFYYIVNYLSPNSSLEEFLKASNDFCSLSYEQVKSKAHDKSELDYLLTYCFGAVYIVELLRSNYGFNTSTWRNILFKQSVKDVDVGWSLGFMINASSAIPEESPEPPMISLSIFLSLLSFSILMIIFASILLHRNFKFDIKKKKETLLDSIA